MPTTAAMTSIHSRMANYQIENAERDGVGRHQEDGGEDEGGHVRPAIRSYSLGRMS